MAEPVRHPRTGAGLSVPDGWEVLLDPGDPNDTVALLALEPPRPAGRFRANLVLTDLSTGGLGFRDWQRGTDELLARVLDDYLVVDLERLAWAGGESGRRVAHHVGPQGDALTMEQWFRLVDGVGHTLTATVDSWRYDALADTFADVAASWSLPEVSA